MKPLDYAITEIGNEEIPRGSNWGIHVQKYLKDVGINFPASWCMAYVYWCVDEWAHLIGISNPLVKTGGVLAQWNTVNPAYKIKAPFVTPLQPGDIFIMDFGKGLGHTGFVESVVSNGDKAPVEINTIEGNTNDTGSREGYEVCRRKRKISSCVGFIRIPLEQAV